MNSTIYTVPIDGDEARVFTSFTPYGTNAHGITFDRDALKVASTASTSYMGYCRAEIVSSVLARMLPDLDDDTIRGAVESSGLTCNCECDCGACEDCAAVEGN